MKKLTYIFPLLALLALFGCQAPPRRVAFNTLATIGNSVDAAMKTYAAANARGLITPEQRAEITRIHDTQFNPMFEAAVTAAHGDLAQNAPQSLVDLATKLIGVIDSIVNQQPRAP